MRYIDKIGFELEGGWNAKAFYTPLNGTFTEDCSIDILNREGCSEDCTYSDCELTHPLEYRSEPQRSVAEVVAELASIAPLYEEANRTCGFHIHVSFKRKGSLAALMDERFHDAFLTELYARYPVIQETRKENHFCDGHLFSEGDTDGYASRSYGLQALEWPTRYTAINFNSYYAHGTVEFRIFNASEDFNLLGSYVAFLADFIERWLSVEVKRLRAQRELDEVEDEEENERVYEHGLTGPPINFLRYGLVMLGYTTEELDAWERENATS